MNYKTICPFALLLLLPLALFAQNGHSGPDKTIDKRIAADSSENPPTLRAVRMVPAEEIRLDGILDESIWSRAPMATGFTQRSPNDGSPATERTEVHVAYTDNALYVAARVFDSAMDSVAATLFRRDGSAYSDWFYANIDSYNDNRTSFSFAVNPRGVRKDLLIYDDRNEDLRWDAVWEAATAIDGQGWTVEMRIPLSQLRFDTSRPLQEWGINFQRRLARKEEIAFWSPTPQDESGIVSQFGTLHGLEDIEKPANLELVPYTSGSLTRAPGSSVNPYYSPGDWSGRVGADLKYGITSDFTVTATLNPDFGQVEADPAVINLSAFETFYPEQRPFFLEGTDIFQFGRTRTFNSFGNPVIFYSRRIGREPQGGTGLAGIDATYSDPPQQTTIAGAAKFSGKTDGGLSLGVLNAYTLREKSPYRTPGGTEEKLSVEPPANYFVGRVKQDFNDGNTVVGGYLSAVNRFTEADYLDSHLHKNAYVGGFDFEHNWNNREWILSGVVSGSSVSGTPKALEQTQRSSARYYDRVDADYLSVDPGRTQLGGLASELSIGRFGGNHWRASFTHSMVTPGYEVNDLGFENRADYNALSALVVYYDNDPGKLFRYYEVGTYANQAWNFGGERTFHNYSMFAYMQFNNLWRFNINAGYNGPQFNDRLMRGGPLATRPTDYSLNASITTNQTRTLSVSGRHYRRGDRTGDQDRSFFIDITIRPTSYIQLTLSPDYSYQTDTDQYVTTVTDELATDTYGRRYVLADINQKTLATGLRLDWTFNPNMTLQLYARPFISSGDFYNFKEFRAPRSFDFDVYGTDKGTISKEEGIYTVDPDAGGPAESFQFPEQDFNFRSVQTNMVFRWEYRPGSTFYLVWQQDRSSFGPYGDLQFSRDVSGLADTRPTNVFLVKMSYWFGS